MANLIKKLAQRSLTVIKGKGPRASSPETLDSGLISLQPRILKNCFSVPTNIIREFPKIKELILAKKISPKGGVIK